MKTYSLVGIEEGVHQPRPTKETIFLLVRLMGQVYSLESAEHKLKLFN